MKRIVFGVIVLSSLGMLASCKGGSSGPQTATPAAATPATPSTPIPTATEVFHLRSECARLAEKMLENDVVGIALTKSQLSHYNPQSNRCYVELSAQTADLTDPNIYASDTLYDGQTGELLAQRTFKGRSCPVVGPDCKMTGNVFDKHHESSVGKTSYDDASGYIDSLMDDDRKR